MKMKNLAIEQHNQEPLDAMIEFLDTLIEYNKITIKLINNK